MVSEYGGTAIGMEMQVTATRVTRFNGHTIFSVGERGTAATGKVYGGLGSDASN